MPYTVTQASWITLPNGVQVPALVFKDANNALAMATTNYVINQSGLLVPAPTDINGNPQVSITGSLANIPVSEQAKYFLEESLFNALAITDTSTHYSAIIDMRGIKGKVLYFNNTLNQSVTLAVMGARTNAITYGVTLGVTYSLTAGNSVAIVAYGSGGGTVQNLGLQDTWPYLFVSATCSVAPTSGSLSGYSEKSVV